MRGGRARAALRSSVRRLFVQATVNGVLHRAPLGNVQCTVQVPARGVVSGCSKKREPSENRQSIDVCAVELPAGTTTGALVNAVPFGAVSVADTPLIGAVTGAE